MAAALVWLEKDAGIPEKLVKRLWSGGDIKLAGDRLRVRVFPEREFGFEPAAQPASILYEDDYCLVAHKPAGMKVHPDGEDKRQTTLANAVAAHYRDAGERAAVRHIHRLDEYTSGPVLYAKNEWAQLKLDEAMAAKKIGRTYAAWVEGAVDPALKVIDAPIGRDRHNSRRQRVSPGGKSAVTHVERLAVYGTGRGAASLVRLTLETGRTHQIRVHMAYAGHPLIGDQLYGAKGGQLAYQALHGEQLTFEHPVTGEIVSIGDPWPPELVRLDRELALLRS